MSDATVAVSEAEAREGQAYDGGEIGPSATVHGRRYGDGKGRVSLYCERGGDMILGGDEYDRESVFPTRVGVNRRTGQVG